jgi:outer membrane biosynthesis protein TonB
MGGGSWRFYCGLMKLQKGPRGSNSLSIILLTAVFFLPLFSGIAHSEVDRIALVLAVEKYDHFSASSVTADTGVKIGDALKERGFDVTTVKNPSDAVARAALRDFAQRATGATAAIVIISGHGVSFDGRSYFLPTNAEITRDSDLLSRGLAIPSVAGIVSRAKFGGVFFFMSVAHLPSTMQSVSARPSFANQLANNVVVTFSTSEKIPVSQVDRVTEQAASDFLRGIGANPLTAANLVHSAIAGGEGAVFGSVPELDLSKGPTPPSQPPAPVQPAATADRPNPEAEQRAHEAEERAKDVEARAKLAEEKARAEAQEAEARAREAEARAAEAEAKARATIAAAPSTTSSGDQSSRRTAGAASTAGATEMSDEVKTLTTVEGLIGNAQRMRIQVELRKRNLYKGEIDAVFGDLTREAIRGYQKSRGEQVTGYLTPQQLQSLVGS